MKKCKVRKEAALSPSVMNRLLTVKSKLQRLAQWLSLRASKYSPARLKLLLTMFCLSLCMASVYVGIHSFKKRNALHLTVTPIEFVPLEGSRPDAPARLYPELLHIHLVLQYLDSLGKTAEGIRKRDSLLAGHPHLLDTLRFLDGIYLSTLRKNSKSYETGKTK